MIFLIVLISLAMIYEYYSRKSRLLSQERYLQTKFAFRYRYEYYHFVYFWYNCLWIKHPYWIKRIQGFAFLSLNVHKIYFAIFFLENKEIFLTCSYYACDLEKKFAVIQCQDYMFKLFCLSFISQLKILNL